MSYVYLMANDVWSESDITNRGRAIIESQVSEARQNELRTIMLGHIAQMRQASPEELGEIMQVQALTEQAVIDNAAARADMALLTQVQTLESAFARLLLPEVDQAAVVTVTDEAGVTTEEVDPAVILDAFERSAAFDLIGNASQELLDLYTLRNPQPVEEVVEVAP